MTKILCFSGSAREGSLNKKLAKQAHQCALSLQAESTYLDLKTYPMPIYDGDLEAKSGIPDEAKALKEVFLQYDALFIASPEYNSSFSPLLKNALDWISRSHMENETPLSAYQGKVAALASASPGKLGGLRGLVPLRMMLENIGVIVIPKQLAISEAHIAFDNAGSIAKEVQQKQLEDLVKALVVTTQKLL